MTGDRYAGSKFIPPRRVLPKLKPKEAPLEPRLLEHVRYGLGKLIGVRQLDNGDYAVVVKFGDGATRVLRLEQRYWVTNIASLIPARRAAKAKAVEVEEITDGETEAGEDDEDAAA